VILWKTFHRLLKENNAMTANTSIDPAEFLHDQLATASPDLLSDMLTTFIHLRLTLGSLLSDELGIQLRRVGGGRRLTFSLDESILSGWMASHARVCWVANSTPWLLETRLIENLVLPLNLDQNKHSGFHAELSAARARQRTTARELPVVTR
jgi:hypothetical protein